MVKEASQYSIAWRAVKYPPRVTVNTRAWVVWVCLFSISLWWAHVTVTPEANRMIVFSRGTWMGLKGLIPVGGHCSPISIVGARLEWKNAQKKEKKNKTSDVMNRIIPHRIPFATIWVWRPWKELSRLMSRHHWIQVIIIINLPNKNKVGSKVWNHFTRPEVKIRAPRAPVRGHGLWSTMWKAWFLLIIIFSGIQLLLNKELIKLQIHTIE